MTTEFPSAMREILDHYSVPPLPDGFSDRLILRIAGEGNGHESSLLHIPRNRSARWFGPWARSSKILTTITALSLVTATAAAAGVFGEPTYIPLISQVLASSKLVDDPRELKFPPKHKQTERPATAMNAVSDHELHAPANGTQALAVRIQNLREDPAFMSLPPRERLATARAAIQKMVLAGEATPQEAREVVRNLIKNADPAMKIQWRDATKERLRMRQAIRQPIAERASSEINKPAAQDKSIQTQPDTLRDRLRDSSPEQRAALRNFLQRRRQARQELTR
jgi:polyhydroxyalkanoate synthesis regulator phasin